VLARQLVSLIASISYFFKIESQGGFAHGNAVGNTYGFGDDPIVDLPALQQKGKVIVYISSSNPSTVVPTETPPSFQKMVVVTHMSKPLFDGLGKKWPTIKNPGKLYYLNSYTYTDIIGWNRIYYFCS